MTNFSDLSVSQLPYIDTPYLIYTLIMVFTCHGWHFDRILLLFLQSNGKKKEIYNEQTLIPKLEFIKAGKMVTVTCKIKGKDKYNFSIISYDFY